MSTPYPRLHATRRTGSEALHASGAPLGPTLAGFWAWSGSDLVSNTSRGVLAEYIVATALGCDLNGVRNEWRAYDLDTPEGVKVEVKSCAFLQSWFQEAPSDIVFQVPRRRAWDADTNVLEKTARRHSDVYVLALHAHMQKPTLDPLDVSQWRFYVVPTRVLNERQRSQHSITLKPLEKLTGGSVSFGELREAVAAAASA